jgi:hypothetical protein|tara:strand:+ start:348 stop:1163 length:816 start_codon:yes stop_codon:yes gene_type:complete
MSNLSDLQGFLNKERRNADLSPVKRKEPPDNRDLTQKDKESLEGATKAMEEAREQSKIDAARAGMADVLEDRLEDKGITKPSPPLGTYMMEKDGGGDGGGGLASGGTVAVASDPGVFTPTFGGDSKRRMGIQSKKKKNDNKDKSRTSGVTKLDRFLRGEPVNQTDKKKSVSVQEFATWLVEDAIVNKKLDPTKRRPGVAGVPENYVDDPPSGKSYTGPVRNPWGRGGKMKPAKGQQFLTDFMKMENISRVLETEGSVMSLMKAIDIDIPVK